VKRHVIAPRPNWRERAEEVGFTYHTSGKPSESGDGTYWDESVAYEFTSAEIDELEAATEEVHARCLDAVDRVFSDRPLMKRMGIPEAYHDYIQWSWARNDPTLYGRFDFAYDGKTPPKMLEYNADTPTMIIESAMMQWFWLQDQRRGADQFNSLHEKLLERFGEIRTQMTPGERFYFAGFRDNEEESQTCRYLQDLATQAGMDAHFIDLGEIGWLNNQFVDLEDRPIKYWFKLYPWEWMFTDEFGEHTRQDVSGIVEPIWKCVLSNKGILPVLHEMFPNHPNILPAHWDDTRLKSGSYVSKPMLSREGANITVFEQGKEVARTDGKYHGHKIYQERASLFQQDGHYAVIGSWVVGNQSAGIIVRDSGEEIVRDLSRVVPHWFL
jgi:glutathionylspermidine synthase